MDITRQNAWIDRESPATGASVPRIDIPDFMHRIVETAVAMARRSPHINQASGVSVRTSIACVENMVSSAERRGILTGEDHVVPRICDLQHLTASCRGKIELMLAEDGQGSEDKLVASLIGEAVKDVFSDIAEIGDLEAISAQFDSGLSLVVSDEIAAANVVASMKHVEGLLAVARDIAMRLKLDAGDEQVLASVGEFALEALYVNNRLSKSVSPKGSSYRR